MKTRLIATTIILATVGFVGTAMADLPDPGVTIVPGRTALLITDPQNDFLSPEGVAWGVVGKSVTDNNTVDNIDALFAAAKANDMPVFISPHYYYPTDHGWHFEGALEALMHAIHMFDREGALTTDNFHAQAPTGWSSTRNTSTTVRPSFQARTRYTARRRTTSFCNCASAASTKSSSAACRPISVPNRICVN